MSPKISVVTVCYNAIDSIEKTILSVINQTYQNIEYIIIDGGSTDGTVNIIKKYADYITYWVSEPDKGIYDAMNKSLNYLNGDFVLFLNSGDTFYTVETVSLVFSNHEYSKEIDVIYGDTKYIMKWGWYELIPDKIEKMSIRCPFCHQSAFIRTHSILLYRYDIRYKFAADYNLFHTMWKEGHKMTYVPITLSIFDGNIPSFSVRHPFLVRKEEMAISNGETLRSKLAFIQVFLKAIASKLLLFIPISAYIRNKRFKNNPLIKSYSIFQ